MLEANYIYKLSDPIDDEVRYVGRTNNPQGRYQIHLRGKGPIEEMNIWINDLQEQDLLPVMTIIEEVPHKGKVGVGEREQCWMRFYTEQGANLFNKPLKEVQTFPIVYKLPTPPEMTVEIAKRVIGNVAEGLRQGFDVRCYADQLEQILNLLEKAR